jgi:hypothetical protein
MIFPAFVQKRFSTRMVWAPAGGVILVAGAAPLEADPD